MAMQRLLVVCWIIVADSSMVLPLQEAIYQLLRLAGLLEALPLPARSAQADLVAASISQKATLAEREVNLHSQLMRHPCIYPRSSGFSTLLITQDRCCRAICGLQSGVVICWCLYHRPSLRRMGGWSPRQRAAWQNCWALTLSWWFPSCKLSSRECRPRRAAAQPSSN